MTSHDIIGCYFQPGLFPFRPSRHRGKSSSTCGLVRLRARAPSPIRGDQVRNEEWAKPQRTANGVQVSGGGLSPPLPQHAFQVCPELAVIREPLATPAALVHGDYAPANAGDEAGKGRVLGARMPRRGLGERVPPPATGRAPAVPRRGRATICAANCVVSPHPFADGGRSLGAHSP